jgi:hypothetical protein
LTTVPPFTARGLSRPLTSSAPGGKRGNLKLGCTISLGRLQYIRWFTHRHHTEEDEDEKEEEEDEEEGEEGEGEGGEEGKKGGGGEGDGGG